MASPLSPALRYTVTWGVLLVLTTATLLLSFVDSGSTAMTVALGFSFVKAGIVAWVFMHLSDESLSSRLALVVGVLLIALLAGLIVGDVALRPDVGVRLPPVIRTPIR